MKTVSILLAVAALASGVSGAQHWYPRPINLTNKAKFARWVVHEANFTILATSSAQYGGVAFPNLLAVSDGTGPYNCTAGAYLYVTSQSTVVADLAANPRVTLGFYEAGFGDLICKTTSVTDPEDPNCSKVHLTGTLDLVGKGSNSSVAEEYLFWRHPAMKLWPADHEWLTYSVNIETVDVLDIYGPLASVSLDDFKTATCY